MKVTESGSGVLFCAIVFLAMAGICKGQAGENDIWNRSTLTNGFWGLNNELTNEGIELGFGITSIYQVNVRGGSGTGARRGRHSGSYDLELSVDLHKLLGFETGGIYMLVEGGWPDAEGIDAASVGSYFGVNADAIGNDAMLVKELYYQGPLFGDSFTIMLGKIDFTGVFDASAYADDECTQFLNAAFVDNPTIPFPDYSLGIVLNWDITDSLYLAGGVADAQADGRETGFRTAFYDEDYFFYALETGITPKLNSTNGLMPGAYRVGMWVDGQDKGRFSNSRNYRDDTGVYVSCDQMVYKENNSPDDSQGLGIFGRFGYANSDLNPVGNFWSIGLQYEGLLYGRDNDILGIGFAQGIFSDYAGANDGADYTENHENALEVYYNAQVAPWLSLSPGIQYISNTGGDETVKDAVVLGLRAQMIF
ncbi:MAG TPA: carbohydrate porin [Planctomycetes bacterium]|nr:carbohydrate porin [Planctomycetota bacterium]